MKTKPHLVVFLFVLSCSQGGEPDESVPNASILSIETTDVPGVFAVSGSEGPYTYDCNEGSQGQALVVDGRWLSARDLPDAQGECRLLAPGMEASAYVSVLPGQLEMQRRRIDPIGDGGLGPWEARAVESQFADLLSDPSLEGIAWMTSEGRLQVLSETGQLEVERVWASGSVAFRSRLVQGEDPCAQLQIDGCAKRLLAFFESPEAPDALLLAHPEAKAEGQLVRTTGWKQTVARPPLFVWGQGQGDENLGSVEAVDLALAVAKSLGREMGLGYGQDGALAETYLPRQDGDHVAGLLPEASDRVVVLVIEGLSQTLWQAQRSQLAGLSRLAQEGVVSTGGLLGSISGDQIPMFASLMTGSRGGHHGLIANRYWMRGQKRIQPLSMGISGDLEGVQGASLRRPSQSLFRLFGDSDHWTVALGTAPCLEVETCTASGRGPAADKWRRMPEESAFAALPQAPEWSAGESSGDWEDSVIMMEYARRLVLGLSHPQRPALMVAGIPGYRRMAERYGSESFQALEMLIAVDSLLASLLDEMSTRELNQQVTLVVTADAAVIESDAERPLPSWWAEGEITSGFRSIKGQLYVDALAMEREVDGGFVTLRITDADLPGEALNRVRFTLYNGAGEEQAQHFPNADGSLRFASPSDRETYGIARLEGFADLVISNTELRR